MGTKVYRPQRDDYVPDGSEVLDDHPHTIARELLLPRIAARNKRAVRTIRTELFFFSKIRAGRQCSCFGVEDSPDTKCRCCFVPGTLVRTSAGYRPIEEIQVGDLVLSSDGLFHKVTETFEHDFSGNLVGLNSAVSTNPILATPDHPFMTVRGAHSHVDGCGPKCDRYIRNGDGDGTSRSMDVRQIKSGNWHARAQIQGSRGSGRVVLGTFPTKEQAESAVQAYRQANFVPGHSLEWDEAENLGEGHWLVAKWPVETSDLDEIHIPADHLKASHYRKARIGDTSFKVDEDFLWMVGMYIAGGSTEEREINFSLHAEEVAYQERLQKYFQDRGYNPTVSTGPGHRATVRVYSASLASWFPEWLGQGSASKQIPEELMCLPPHKAMALIQGVYDGDVSVREPAIDQTSEVLALQLSELLHRAGNQPLVSRWQSAILTPNGNKRKPVYSVTWTKEESIGRNRKGRWNFKDQEVLARINATNRIPYQGKVYNLEVEGDHTYVVNGVVTHNCWGQGIVGGYQKYGTDIFTLDTTYPSIRTVNVITNHEFQERPRPLTLIDGATFGYAEFVVPIGTNIGSHDVFLPVTKFEHGQIDGFIKSPADSDFVDFTETNFNQRLANSTLTIRFELRRPNPQSRTPRFYCFHGRYRRFVQWKVVANVPRTQRSQFLGDFGLTDAWEAQHFYLDNTIKSITTEDFVATPDGQTRWKIINVNPFDPEDQLLSWDLDTRLIHPYEPYAHIPL